MTIAILNIGMERSKHAAVPHEDITPREVYGTLVNAGLRVCAWKVEAAAHGELTYVAAIYNPTGNPLADVVDLLCHSLDQDCIAYRDLDGGHLVGPRADEWGGEFVQEFFLEI